MNYIDKRTDINCYSVSSRPACYYFKIHRPIYARVDLVATLSLLGQNQDELKEKYIYCLPDYISGPTAVLFPIREIVQLCKEHDVMSLVDGAHTPGHIEPMVEDIMPDFYTGKAQLSRNVTFLMPFCNFLMFI